MNSHIQTGAYVIATEPDGKQVTGVVTVVTASETTDGGNVIYSHAIPEGHEVTANADLRLMTLDELLWHLAQENLTLLGEVRDLRQQQDKFREEVDRVHSQPGSSMVIHGAS